MVKYNIHLSIKVKVKLLKNKMHLRVGWVEQRLYLKKKKKKVSIEKKKSLHYRWECFTEVMILNQ